MLHEVPNFIHVDPREGRETQLVHWFRLCVAEWNNGINPRNGIAIEELLVWDKGRQCYVLEVHRYGRELPHDCQRNVVEHDGIRAWIARRGNTIIWRDDAQIYYPSFVIPRLPATAQLPAAHARAGREHAQPASQGA